MKTEKLSYKKADGKETGTDSGTTNYFTRSTINR